jgi:hypothetical protein
LKSKFISEIFEKNRNSKIFENSSIEGLDFLTTPFAAAKFKSFGNFLNRTSNDEDNFAAVEEK